jgi:hypothetical protein
LLCEERKISLCGGSFAAVNAATMEGAYVASRDLQIVLRIALNSGPSQQQFHNPPLTSTVSLSRLRATAWSLFPPLSNSDMQPAAMQQRNTTFLRWLFSRSGFPKLQLVCGYFQLLDGFFRCLTRRPDPSRRRHARSDATRRQQRKRHALVSPGLTLNLF